jgi:hypothetical protein
LQVSEFEHSRDHTRAAHTQPPHTNHLQHAYTHTTFVTHPREALPRRHE